MKRKSRMKSVSKTKHKRLTKVKPTKKWFRYVIADEKKANKDYIRHGFPKIAKQEAHHKEILTKAYEKMR